MVSDMDMSHDSLATADQQLDDVTAQAPDWPPSREAAIAKLIELDVAQWGEEEREVSAERRGRLCHALALNALAFYDQGNVDEPMAVEARRILLKADRAARKAGKP